MRRLFLPVLLSALLSMPMGALAQTPVPTPPTEAVATAPAIPVVAAPPVTAPATPAPAVTDPLADLIAASGPQTTDEEDEAQPAAPAPRHKPTILPIPAPETAAPAAPGGAMSVEQAYELRVKGSIAAAQGLQGPLDGGWTIRGADGTALYALQIVDPAGGYGPVEGAWRDLRRPGAVGSTGLIDSIERTYDGGAAVRFMARAGVGSTLSLTVGPDGAWSGRLAEDGVAATAVGVERTGAMVLPAGYASAARGPVVWPPRIAPAARTAAAPAKAAPCVTKGKKGKALKAAKAKCAAAAKKSGKGSVARKGKAGKGKAVKSGGKKKPAASGARKKRR
ncbi:hypothetical protein [Caulobacter hibisci]|uniref:Uncharacterized protein n=1 Tax=Caulobacter hibisci TaxID=2035993 RepID=A0ABS0SUX9_9CAUL|nr:hypothetical protein [Caulobacter hibisci]MBI1683403.1 hypothetical protein [Caulobacter hibisci]